jgi:hypothetical protein
MRAGSRAAAGWARGPREDYPSSWPGRCRRRAGVEDCASRKSHRLQDRHAERRSRPARRAGVGFRGSARVPNFGDQSEPNMAVLWLIPRETHAVLAPIADPRR